MPKPQYPCRTCGTGICPNTKRHVLDSPSCPDNAPSPQNTSHDDRVRVSQLVLPPVEDCTYDSTVVTLTDRNYEAGAALLLRSVRRVHPSCKVLVYTLDDPSSSMMSMAESLSVDLVPFRPSFEYRGQGWQTFGKPEVVANVLEFFPDVTWIDADAIVVRSLDGMPNPCWPDHVYHLPVHESAWPGVQSPNAGIFRVDSSEAEFIDEWRERCERAVRVDPLALPYYDQGILDVMLAERRVLLEDGRQWTDFRPFRETDPQAFIAEVFDRNSRIVHLGDRQRPWQDWTV